MARILPLRNGENAHGGRDAALAEREHQYAHERAVSRACKPREDVKLTFSDPDPSIHDLEAMTEDEEIYWDRFCRRMDYYYETGRWIRDISWTDD